MPWTEKDALRHTKKADSPAKRKVWSATANSVLERTGDEAQAVRTANSAVKHYKPKKATIQSSR